MENKDLIKKIDECIGTAKHLYNLLSKEKQAEKGSIRIMNISLSDKKEDTQFELRINLPEETFRGGFYLDNNEVKGFETTKDMTHDDLMASLMDIIEFYQGHLGENFNIIWLGD